MDHCRDRYLKIIDAIEQVECSLAFPQELIERNQRMKIPKVNQVEQQGRMLIIFGEDLDGDFKVFLGSRPALEVHSVVNVCMKVIIESEIGIQPILFMNGDGVIFRTGFYSQ
jgi:hypothetical protein